MIAGICIVWLGIIALSSTAEVVPQQTTEEESTPETVQEELLQEYDFQELNTVTADVWNTEGETFENLVQTLMEGDVPGDTESWLGYLYQFFLEELAANQGILIKLLLLAIITAVFTNLSGSMGKGFIHENGFYITYLIMTALLMSSFYLIYQVAQEALEEMLYIMEALIPTYMLAVTFSSGMTSSTVFQESMVMGITAVSWAVQKIVFPMIQLFVLLGLVNNLTEEDFFSKLSELLQTSIRWILKTVLAFVVGLNAVKSMLAPVTDSVTSAALQRGFSAIPGGQAVNAVSGVVIGSGVLIKNAIGVGGMLLIIFAVSVPVIKMTVFILSYKFIAAILQPISDKRMIKGIQSISDGGQLLISTVLTVIVLFLLSIAIVAVSTNIGYYSG